MSSTAPGGKKIEVRKELFWEAPYTGCRLDATILGYVSTRSGRLLGRVRESVLADDETTGHFRREYLVFSDDRGQTWQEGESFDVSEHGSHIVYWDYLDEETDIHLLFLWRRELQRAKRIGRHPMTYSRQLYRVSRDGGHTWGPEQLLVQRGAEFSEAHVARREWYGKNGGCICNTPLRLRNGTILFPYALWPWDARKQVLDTSKDSAVFMGKWAPDFSHLEWELGDYIRSTREQHGSLCEMTLAELPSGDILAIMRANPPNTLSKFYCLSSDGGRAWSEPKALTYDNGELLLSPSAVSRLIRSSRNGKLYWIGNILPFRADHYMTMPDNWHRFILQIAEVNEDSYGIKQETVTTIDESTDDTLPREYSNPAIYEDRDSGNFILTMTSACALPLSTHEVPESYTRGFMTKETYTSHSYRYEIAV
ncbi:MAG: hypothetical protein CL878_06425 [Dehalococcoidia bacterium]|nr:hypothetical protein [Dehalococcoidia bacterium]